MVTVSDLEYDTKVAEAARARGRRRRTLAYTTQRRTPHGTHGVGMQGATLHARSAGQVPVHARRRRMREDVCTSKNGACEKTAPLTGAMRTQIDRRRAAIRAQMAMEAERRQAEASGEAATECTRRRALHGG